MHGTLFTDVLQCCEFELGEERLGCFCWVLVYNINVYVYEEREREFERKRERRL